MIHVEKEAEHDVETGSKKSAKEGGSEHTPQSSTGLIMTTRKRVPLILGSPMCVDLNPKP